MEVRRPEDDAERRALRGVNRRAWLAAYDDLLPASVLERVEEGPPVETGEERLAQLRDDGVLVAVDGEQVVGYAYFRWGEETKAFVGDGEAGLKELYVDPDYWSEGVGTALLERGLALLPERATALRLETLAGNDIGRRFYEARGFEATGETEVDTAGEPYPAVVYSRPL